MRLFRQTKRGGAGRAQADRDREFGEESGESVGRLLRDSRESYGGSIEQIGAALRIRPAYLVAIEESRWDRLPGPTYAVGFVRTYAEHLGLDGAEMARRFKEEAAGLDKRRDLAFPMPLPERSNPGPAILIVALIVASCAYGTWYYVSAGERARPARVAALPSDLLPPPAPTMPAPPSLGESGGAAAAALPAPPAVPPAPVSPSVSPAPYSVPLVPPATPPAPPAAAPPPPATASAPAPPAPTPVQEAAVPLAPDAPVGGTAPDAPRVYGLTNGPSRVLIRATADSWIQIRDRDSAQARILKPGDTYRVPDKPGLTMRTGNAGGLEIVVDGKPAPPVGPAGKARNVALDPDRLLTGKATLE